MLPVLRELALKASAADVHFTIDAEEADRLELSLDIFEALLADDALFANGWGGFGLAIQAYQKRAVPLCDWVADAGPRARPQADGPAGQGRLLGHRDQGRAGRRPARLSGVHAQGRDRRVLPRLRQAAARRERRHLPGLRDPQRQHASARSRRWPATTPFEFQRLHGMGEGLYEELAKLERGDRRRRRPRCGSTRRSAATRNCSPISSAGCSRTAPIPRFVNRIADEQVSLDELVRDPVAELAALEPKRNPAIPLPRLIFGEARRNSAGVDLVRSAGARAVARAAEGARKPRAGPPGRRSARAKGRAVTSPHDRRIAGRHGVRSERRRGRPHGPRRARRAAGLGRARRRSARQRCSTAPPTSSRSIAKSSSRLCIREAGKTLVDAVLEVREAVDFLRFYASEARRQFSRPMPLPGPTGEQNELRLHGRGVFACISPWNFPLAIFTGLVAAPLAAGNAVDRQAGRADAADRRAGGRADARGGHPQGRRPARARRRQGRSAER